MSKEYIERGALLKDIEESVVFSVRLVPSAEMRGANKIVERIKCAPAADVVEVKHGRWVNKRMTVGGLAENWAYDCSECGKADGSPFRPRFCPNCGARMDGGAEDVE